MCASVAGSDRFSDGTIAADVTIHPSVIGLVPPVMIDWASLGIDLVWISGLALIFAASGYHWWVARVTRRPWREVGGQRPWRISSRAGLLLVAAGLAAAQARRPWERAVWAVLALVFAYQLLTGTHDAWRSRPGA
jgi:hypothetical protein